METSEVLWSYSIHVVFKSYYVVWKPDKKQAPLNRGQRLNRTM